MYYTYAEARPTTVEFQHMFNFIKTRWDEFFNALDNGLNRIHPISNDYENIRKIVQRQQGKLSLGDLDKTISYT